MLLQKQVLLSFPKSECRKNCMKNVQLVALTEFSIFSCSQMSLISSFTYVYMQYNHTNSIIILSTYTFCFIDVNDLAGTIKKPLSNKKFVK